MFTDFYGSPKKPVEWNPFYKLLSKYYALEVSSSPDFLIYSNFGCEYLKYDCIRIFITGENVRPNYQECDYAFSFDFPFTERNYRLPLYRLYKGYDLLLQPRNPEAVMTQYRKFCSFLVSNEAPDQRIKLFELLSEYKKVDSGGKFRNNIGAPVPRGQEIAWLSNYKFNITYENSSYPGYTTEKLLHSLAANAIPIYWGNPLVGDDFNTRAFINCHEYNSLEDVVERIKEIDSNDNLYREMLDQPFLPGGVEVETNKEERIVEKFASIFASNKVYIPSFQKRIQRTKYPFLKSRKWFINRLKPTIKKLVVGNPN